HFRGGGHHVFGERPRERADFLAVKARVLAKHAARLDPETLARAVDTLRAELVEEREEHGAARRDLGAARASLAAVQGDLSSLAQSHGELSREHFALEARYHAQNGELAAQKEFAEQERREIERLYAEEAKLRGAIDDQTAHLGRTYAEIERLNGLVREMEATRAWRLHKLLERRRS
ncbi:MAG TPA: hypothetical protein VGE98_10335, partial [Thermoanaerobaculia bacterium]